MPEFEKMEEFVSIMGKWAWVIVLINGILYLLYGIVMLSLIGVAAGAAASTFGAESYHAQELAYASFQYTWWIIGGIIVIIFAVVIIKPKFSDKCADQDWDFLLNYVLELGSIRIPWMLIFGIIVFIFGGHYWGAIPILVPAIILIFWGPEEYQWKKE